MKSAAIIYGRTNSTRFPKKCFAPLGKADNPLAHWVVKRAENLNVDLLVFATTNKSSDDELTHSLQELGISNLNIFRGNESDLVQRTVDCLLQMEIDLFARINGDSPFFPVSEINQTLSLMTDNNNCKFASNLKERTYPYGVAVEVVNASFYIENALAANQDELEHTTQHLYRIASDQIISVDHEFNLNKVSLTIDTESDYGTLNDMIVNRDLRFDSDWRCLL